MSDHRELTEEQETEAAVQRMADALDSTNEETGVVVREPQHIAATDDDHNSLVRLALERDVDIDKLERIIALRDREEARNAKRVPPKRRPWSLKKRKTRRVSRPM